MYLYKYIDIYVFNIKNTILSKHLTHQHQAFYNRMN